VFKGLVTGSDTAGADLWDNCHKRNWIISERKFNNFNILLLSDVDGIDENGSRVEVKLFDEAFCSEFTSTLRSNLTKQKDMIYNMTGRKQ